MLENFLPHSATADRLRVGLFGPHLDSFVTALCELGYAKSTVRVRLRFLDNLGRWLGRQSLALDDLQEQVVNRFLEQRRRQGRLQKGDALAARHFLEYLRQKGAVCSPEPLAEKSSLATLRRQYESHLEKERGLAAVTAAGYWRHIRRLLVERFGDTPIRVRDLTPDDVSHFLLRHAHAGSPGGARLMVTALRSFFRFLFLHGQTEVNLAAAVPTVPHWQLAELPKYLRPEEVKQIIRAC
jgi:site-specific recombinase XerD